VKKSLFPPAEAANSAQTFEALENFFRSPCRRNTSSTDSIAAIISIDSTQLNSNEAKRILDKQGDSGNRTMLWPIVVMPPSLKLTNFMFIYVGRLWCIETSHYRLNECWLTELQRCREDLVVQEDYYCCLNNLSFTVNYNLSLENNEVLCWIV
jgi:hypothetical protein